ncbi:EEF1A lysine methyltransferase 2-like isoform X2 [Littorina saxatilis]|uniref:EEF1A lysine methyltransferase 2-like isoform X2 n=1 Tax=Littorina saxatilis TaxID=31220 RepID=UPI0038B6442E
MHTRDINFRWETAYSREFKTFQDIGDIGEIWFGEDSQERMVDWLDDCDDVSKDDAVLDLGCGNGALLLELRQRGFTHLSGVDYVQEAINLAAGVLAKKGFTNVRLQTGDLTADLSSLPAVSCLRCKYRVCVDKGTYDAISLTPGGAKEEREAYRRNVRSLLQPDGLFLITSCNWTKQELMDFFQPDFKLASEIRTPSFQFGGKVGRSVTSLIFS